MYSLCATSRRILSSIDLGDMMAMRVLVVLTPLAVVAYGLPNMGRVTGLELVCKLTSPKVIYASSREREEVYKPLTQKWSRHILVERAPHLNFSQPFRHTRLLKYSQVVEGSFAEGTVDHVSIFTAVFFPLSSGNMWRQTSYSPCEGLGNSRGDGSSRKNECKGKFNLNHVE